MKFTILGDVHGDRARCNKVCQKAQKKSPGSEVIQIGDLGVGFRKLKRRARSGLYVPEETGELDTSEYQKLPPYFKFFPGNHDNRTECKKLPHCLGDYGEYKGFFFVSGANSVDRVTRTEGVDWWADEELTYNQLQDAITAWCKSDAKVLLSHDGPADVAKGINPTVTGNRTRSALQQMIQLRTPELVIFGHWHIDIDIVHDGVRYVCLGINRTIDIEIKYES